jgi:hypothetical protein
MTVTLDFNKTPSAEHIVIVRDSGGRVVHTHEILYFDDAEPLSESDAQEEAIKAAKAHHPSRGDDLVAAVSPRSDLEQTRAR